MSPFLSLLDKQRVILIYVVRIKLDLKTPSLLKASFSLTLAPID